MRIVITGGCGFLGRRVALKLLADGSPLGPVDELVLFDNAPSALPLPEDKRLTLVTGDIADRETVARADHARHRCGVPSRRDRQRPGRSRHRSRLPRQSRRHPRRARRLPGARNRARGSSSPARSRSMAAALPPAVGDDTALTPQTSYGTQKAIGELLVNDYSRKGFVDGRARATADRRRAAGPAKPRRLDLCLLDDPRAPGRPGSGLPGVARHGHGVGLAAPHRRRARACARHLRARRSARAGHCSCRAFRSSVGEMAAAMRRAGGEAAYARICAGSPTRRSRRSSRAGRRRWRRRAPRRSALAATTDIDEVVQAFIEDDLPLQKELAG